MSGAPTIKYIPQDYERAYYQALFKVADTAGRGQIGGAEAVQFFTRSKLPIDTLKNIWTVADQPPSNYLDLPKFAVAVRLIQCMQNGQRGQGANLATPPGVVMRPAMFEGVSGVTVPFPIDPGPGAPGAGPPRPSPTPMPPQQQHQPPAPPQQQQYPQPPPPHQQQHHMSMVQPQPQQQQSTSTALTAQDPYFMGPSDFSRYESIFQEYGKEDGYVYGGEAVALFSKSGMPQQALAAIWNMVDHPVDNRLDKVEFAIAMHLIVCVSKKNMPMPPSLPNSLVQLKQQKLAQQQQQQSLPPVPQPQPQQYPQPHLSPTRSLPSPTPQHQLQQPYQQPSHGTDAAAAAALVEAAGASAAAALKQVSQPPPLSAAQGGMSISDAFEGLGTDPTTPEMFAPPPEPAPVEYAPPMPSSPEPAPAPVVAVPATAPLPGAHAATAQAGMSSSMSASAGGGRGLESPDRSSPPTASSVMGTSSSSTEVMQMRELLQKLQAENISLKAQLSGTTEDERDVQKELSMTIAEVARLSSVLSGLRQQVAAQKQRLADLTATLKSAKDNAGLLKSLIDEETATKDALELANQTLMTATAGGGVRSQVEAPEDMFSAPPPQSNGYGQTSSQPAAYGQTPTQPAAYGQSSSQPAAYGQPSSARYGQAPRTSQADNSSVEMTLDMAVIPEVSSNMEMSAATPQSQEFNGPTSTHQGSYDYPQQQSGQQQQPISTSNFVGAPSSSLSQGSGHNRNLSTASAFGFDDGDIMGGRPLATVAAGPSIDFSSSAAASAAEAQQKPPPAPQVDFEELRKQAKEAGDIANEAEENSLSLLTQLSEARGVAEEAEEALNKLRRSSEVNKDKKKGLFGGGGKPTKKELKMEQQLAIEAKAKKDELLQLQGRANDAQALAMETRREADRLQRAVEEAEMAQASANSLQEQQSPLGPQSISQMASPRSNGEQQPHNNNISKTFYPPQQQPAHDASSPNSGYNPNVMSNSSGGFSIPDPTYDANAYDNPFES
ncbi:hypothetical protein ACA910_019046 [Epithemia clementina (nom. ined.)]